MVQKCTIFFICIQVIVCSAYILHIVLSFFSAFFVFLAKVSKGIKNPEPFDFKGFRNVWVERFELSAS